MKVVVCESLSWHAGDKRFKLSYFDHDWNEIEALCIEHATAELALNCIATWMIVRLGRSKDEMGNKVLGEVGWIDVEEVVDG